MLPEELDNALWEIEMDVRDLEEELFVKPGGTGYICDRLLHIATRLRDLQNDSPENLENRDENLE